MSRLFEVKNNNNTNNYYSFDEIGRYDLPAMIDYVLKETQKDELRYVGFSEGVTTFLVMMNYRPEYNGKISTAIAWAPLTDAYRTKSKIINSLADSRILGWVRIDNKFLSILMSL